MKYYDFLENNRTDIVEKIEGLLTRYKVEPVGNGYIDCIIMKDKLNDFIKEVSELGVLITDASWWCYVNPNETESTGCPHGMGGPHSQYYDGWFSELQNPIYELDEKIVDNILLTYDKQLIYSLNMKSIDEINKILKEPFKYTPTEYIEGNKCVTPGLWLLVPDYWRRI